MAVDFSLLKTLRAETGVSFSLCKKALEETDNNMDKAKTKLKEWGIKKASDKADRETNQGGIFTYVHHNKKIACMVEMLSETDFVSGNDEFQKLGSELAMQAASVPAQNVEELMNQDYIREPGKKVKDLIQEAVLKFGENIKVSRFIRWEIGRE
jgi:elongation factor Ts